MLFHMLIKSHEDIVAEVSAWADDEVSARDKCSKWFDDEVRYGKKCNGLYKDVVTFEISSCVAIDETREIYEDEWVVWGHSKARAHSYHATSDIKYWDVENSIPKYIIDVSRKTLEEIFAFVYSKPHNEVFIRATKDGMKGWVK